MMRTIRLAAYFLVGVLLSAVSVLSYAETIAATSLPYATTVAAWRDVSGWFPVGKPSPLSACAQFSGSRSVTFVNHGSYGCTAPGEASYTVIKYCPAGGTAMLPGPSENTPSDTSSCYDTTKSSYICPAGQNWTLSGATCTRPDCVGDETRNASGICEAAPCPSDQSMFNGKCVGNTCPNGSPRPSGGLCRGAACTSFYGTSKPPGVDYAYESVCQSQGCKQNSWKNATHTVVEGTIGECTPGTNLDPLPCSAGMTMQTIGSTTKCYPSDGSTCASRGQCSGSVNGVTVCVPCAPGVTTTKATASSAATTTTPPGGPASTTTTDGNTSTTTTTNPDGSTTITTTTETTKADGTVEKVVETDTPAAFCAKHPADPICTKKTVCEEYPDRLECKDLGTPTEESALTNKSQGVTSITSVSLAVNETCPADISLPHNMHFSWSPICNSFSQLKPLVLALAWLAASMIVIGAAKNG